uniref:NIF system FeS cluster assembly NifU C-terminal domain-containing protein n=2 Tax=Chrysotila carterae TaxID=13221 RepID=A0A6S9QA72_CHRCT
MDTRSVYLQLQGACGSCPSSTVTMKMGIERVLREKFADIREVAAVEDDAEDVTEGSDAASGLDAEAVLGTLSQIMPAITGLGGSVEVVSVDDGNVQLRYQGPPKIKFGIELALKDNALVKKVEFVD